MKDFTEKYRIRIKIFIYFLLFMVIPYIVLILVVNRTIQNYAGQNAGGNMEETMQSIGNQVKASLEMYENSTMALYNSGCVDMLESGETDRQYIESTLAACSYPYKNIWAVFLKSGGAVLKMPPVHDSYSLYLNGREVPVNPMCCRVPVGEYLKPGENAIEIRVSSTLLNAVLANARAQGLRGVRRPEDIQDWDDYGILGEITLRYSPG